MAISEWDLHRTAIMEAVNKCRTLEQIAAEASGILGRTVSRDAVQCAWRRYRDADPSVPRLIDLLRGPPSAASKQRPRVDAPPAPPPPPSLLHSAAPSDKYKPLIDVTRKGPVSFLDLCDKLGLPPGKARALIEQAARDGVQIQAAHDQVAIVLPAEDDRVRDLKIPPTVGERQHVAVVSDTHLGSKFCNRAALREFVEYAYARGCREVLHPGDVVDGCYKHGTFEVTHSGLEDQTRDLYETLPALDGLTYHAICGNHDDTFSEAGGFDAGDYMQRQFESRGRHDLKFYGRRGAFLRLRGATIHLWHPRSGVAYARSYHLQRQIEQYAPGQKPDILLAGHWHTFVYVEERGVHACACGTFQDPGSAFSKSLGGTPAVGGLILSWELTAHGTLRRFSVERSSYYHREQPRTVEVAGAGC